jgi:hypothetical protein
MNKQIKNRVNRTWIVTVIAVLTTLVIPIAGYSDPAQVGPNPDVPIDGGITLLLAAAGIAGVKKMRDNKEKPDKL